MFNLRILKKYFAQELDVTKTNNLNNDFTSQQNFL